MDEDLRQRIAEAIENAECEKQPRCSDCVTDAVMAVRDEELEQLRYERRLLGAARMVLDLVAAGDSSRWDQARREAEDIAQRIVDEIGHPVTDEPALGPEWRERAENAEIANARTRALHPSADEAHAAGNALCMECAQPAPCRTRAALDDTAGTENG